MIDGSCIGSTAVTCVNISGSASSVAYAGGCDSSHALCCSCRWLCWWRASSSATCSIISFNCCNEGNQYSCATKICKPALSAAECTRASMSSMRPKGLIFSALHSVRSADIYSCCSRLVIRVIGNISGPSLYGTCCSASCTSGLTMMPLDCKFGREESGIRYFSNVVLASTMLCSTTSTTISAVRGGFSLGSMAPDLSLYRGTNLRSRFCACLSMCTVRVEFTLLSSSPACILPSCASKKSIFPMSRSILRSNMSSGRAVPTGERSA